jgi:two-component system sensor kinase FixL
VALVLPGRPTVDVVRSSIPLGMSAATRDIAHAARLAEDLADARARLDVLQSQNEQLSRLAAMDRIGMNLAHELSQPLAAIANYLRAAERLAAKLPADERIQLGVALEGAMTQSLHAGRIVNGLRDFVTRGEADKQIEAVAGLVRQAVLLVMPEAGQPRICVSLAFDPRAAMALVDRSQIVQVLANLLRNAVQAMQDSSRRVLSIGTQRVGTAVQISIADTGKGLPETVRTRLFEPFVTTRPDGTGLGLAICRAIVEAHGGTLAWQAAPDGGSIFRFTVDGVADALP